MDADPDRASRGPSTRSRDSHRIPLPLVGHPRCRRRHSFGEARLTLSHRPERASAARLRGYLATPAGIRFLYRPGAEWRELLAGPALVEARVFHLGADLHWLDGRGVLLQEVTQAQLAAEPPPDAISVGGHG